ncbi:MAG TPA: polysaccharide deacetylase family protein [Stellaceae bacterium]|nr:polysaccharide deacetylase family protein [Stellaceae bacterium]
MIMARIGTAARWEDLDRELDAWQALGRRATFWWRDDDAVADDPRLVHLLTLARGLPIALAVVPAAAEPALAARLIETPSASVIQHGWCHANHAPANEKKAELGAHRPIAVMTAELVAGWQRLKALFGARALPVLAPPWNRITDALVPRLSALGFAALSTYGPRRALNPAPGLVQINAHIDLIDWRRSRRFVGAEAALAQIAAHLARHRRGEMDTAEPTGLLTHHLKHDVATEDFLRALLDRLCRHDAVRWLALGDVFAVP